LGHPTQMPKSYKCFNKIDLPPYEDLEQSTVAVNPE